MSFEPTKYTMENSVEIQASQYYLHKSYTPVYYYMYMRLEDWIAENIFRKDLSRVFLASNEWAFRRRFELTDTSKDYNEIEASSLQFPFANYWPLNSGWQPDTRVAGNQAKMIYDGIYEGTTKVRAAGVVLNIPITFYFDREDDARIAYDTLYFKTYNEHVYHMEVPFANNSLDLPFVIKLNDLKFNPSAVEKDWLVKNRIFVITVNFEIRSYAIYPPKQPDYNRQVDFDNRYEDGSFYSDGYDNFYLTEEVILKLKNYPDLLMSELSVSGIFEENNIEVNLLDIINITESSAEIVWNLGNVDQCSKIQLKVNNTPQQISIDKNSNKYILTDLQGGSIYNVSIIFFNLQGVAKTFNKSFQTLDSQISIEEKEEPKSSLIGLSW